MFLIRPRLKFAPLNRLALAASAGAKKFGSNDERDSWAEDSLADAEAGADSPGCCGGCGGCCGGGGCCGSDRPPLLARLAGLVRRACLPPLLDYTLRGVSQVVVVNNPLSGAVILVALFLGGGAWHCFLAAACTLVATALALAAFEDSDSVRSGLAGYNACLVGCGFAVFICPEAEWEVRPTLAAVFVAALACFLNLALKAGFGR